MPPSKDYNSDRTSGSRRLWDISKFVVLQIVERLDRRMKKTSPEIWAALLSGIVTLVATMITIVLASPEIRNNLFKDKDLQIKRISFYANVTQFRDQATNPNPLFRKKVGQLGSDLVAVRDIFDECHYTISHEFKPHTAPFFEIHSHTSGICEGFCIDPPLFEPGAEIEPYDRSGGKILIRRVNLQDEDGNFFEHVVATSRNHNGFQRKPDKFHYESDVGLHIRYATDLAVMVVDFSNLDHQLLINGDPKVYLVEGHHRRLLESAYENGIVTCRVKHPPAGSEIICDWSWNSESKYPQVQASGSGERTN